MEYLDRFGLKEWSDHLPGELSGGQKQRVAIARALISKPKIILADEPTGALDTATSFEVMEILKEVNDQGITVIIVTHEHDIAAMTRKIIRLKDGMIEETIINGELKMYRERMMNDKTFSYV
jgi:putative ABC transport system ATP-binding protein